MSVDQSIGAIGHARHLSPVRLSLAAFGGPIRVLGCGRTHDFVQRLDGPQGLFGKLALVDSVQCDEVALCKSHAVDLGDAAIQASFVDAQNVAD